MIQWCDLDGIVGQKIYYVYLLISRNDKKNDGFQR